MRGFCLPLLIFCGPMAASADSDAPQREQAAQDVRAEARRLIVACRKGKQPPQRLIRQMLSVYRRLERAPGLSAARRRELQNMLARRMVEQAKRMVRRIKRGKASAAGSASLRAVSYAANGSATSRSSAGGAAVPEQDRARQLIELIQRTICPDSWDVNGGRGTIYYYAPAHALVVRQRGEIHRELRGLLRQLRK